MPLITRRQGIIGLASVIFAPFVVRAESLMPVATPPVPLTKTLKYGRPLDLGATGGSFHPNLWRDIVEQNLYDKIVPSDYQIASTLAQRESFHLYPGEVGKILTPKFHDCPPVSPTECPFCGKLKCECL
jgi:hypothetical protein